MFNIKLHKNIDIFFLPLNKEEIKRTVLSIREKINLSIIDSKFSGGLRYLKQLFEWRTFDVNISMTAKYITRILRHYNLCKNDFEEANIVLGLEELLTNAIEHGNLELTSTEKSYDFDEDDKYEEQKRKRYNDPKYNQRKLFIDVDIKDGIFSISIEDEGPGFDYTKAKAVLKGEVDIQDADLLNPSGKGFWIVRKIFNSIDFANNGRKVILSNKLNS